MYSNIAAGRYKVYDQPVYNFITPDLEQIRDSQRELRQLVSDLEFRVQRHAGGKND
jgi:hypothetical protein